MPEQERDALAQELHKQALGKPEPRKEMSDACRRAGAEGTVLLKNDGVLPLSKTGSTAFFGRVQRDYFYVGYGSGGDVNPDYLVSPMDALEARGDIAYDKALADRYRLWCRANVPPVTGWAQWPTCHPEMPLSEEVIQAAAQRNDAAVVILGRAMGEAMDNRPEPGGYYLTEEEKALVAQVTAAFRKVCVVVDAGNIMDLSWVEEYPIGALVYAFQGGMESGNALIDVLYGDAQPGGRLTDTVPRHYEDAPTYGHFGGRDFNEYREDIYVGYRYYETFAQDKVLYPFGFGLSYTSFRVESAAAAWHTSWDLRIQVTNTGSRPGRQVVQVYVEAPQGKLGKAARVLADYWKTPELAPGQSAEVSLWIDLNDLASFDDSGVTGHPYAYVLEAGAYRLYVGTDVRSASLAGRLFLEEQTLTAQLESQCSPTQDFPRLHPKEEGDRLVPGFEPVPRAESRRKDQVLENLPEPIPFTGDLGISFRDVCKGTNSIDDFIAQLTPEELNALCKGEGQMDSPLGTKGNAGMLGGTTRSLRDKGLPTLTTTDGPSGIRVCYYTALLPCGTALASSWDVKAVEALGHLFGQEMVRKGSDILLGPGLNIHRDPLCGRNFEYYSEDPLLSGTVAAAMVRGIQSVPGRSACVKHFACNNQEENRNRNDSRLSQRALREIYLRGFEICLRDAAPLCLMTSYNQINGIWGHYQYELVTGILRREWGYEGLVMTDWWMQPCTDPDFPELWNDAYRLRAQVDVLMPGGNAFGDPTMDPSALESLRKEKGLTLGEMQRSAKNVLKLCAGLKG